MKNSKTIGVAVIVLAIMNLSLLVFLWYGHKHNQRLLAGTGAGSGGAGNGLVVLTSKLGLSEGQKEQLEIFRREHFRKMEPLRRQSHETRSKLHALWSSGGTSEQIDSLTARIGELQAQIEKTTFNHFSDIRSICSPDQKRIFDQIIQDVLKQGDRRPAEPRQGRSGDGSNNRPPPRRN